ncbi:MFS transporter [Hydrocarboniphaga sp.]|uniref:MFS transporter n=1 Tax=Hydrocarboniphaga sp. TaxID=2033016 RepID=UPI003D138A79
MSDTPLPRSTLVPLIVACALFMENLDSTVIATALPAIAATMQEDPLHLSLAITAYLLSLSIFIPLSGWMADRYGARRVFRNAILIFVLGSIGCAASQSIGQMVSARMFQGLGGAMMVPVGRLVLLRAVDKRQLVSAMAYLTIPALMAPIMGPPVGGLIVTYASWRLIFLINVPIGMLGWYLVTRFIEDTHEDQQPPLDLAGWMMLGGGLAGVVFGFENLGKSVLPDFAAPVVLGVGILLLLLYAQHARHERSPILRLSLLKVATFRASVTGGSLFRIGVGAFSILMPMMLQLGFGLSAVESGLITFASAVGGLMMKTMAKRLTRRFGFRRLLVINTLVCGSALILCGCLRPFMPYAMMISFLFVTGFLRSLQFTCVNAMAFADIDEDDMSQATSFSATAQQLALSVGVGIGAQVLNVSLALRQAQVLTNVDFTIAFLVVGLISLSSWYSFRRLAPDAGAMVSGHREALAHEPPSATVSH